MKRLLKIVWKTGLILIVTLLLFELCYRYQVVDFYATEYEFLNPDRENMDDRPVILNFGDSFSATSGNYIDQLRSHRPGLQFINAAVPGTGIVQTNMMAGRRINQSQPNAVIYQIYLGNDLFDLENPADGYGLGTMRRVYWWSANRLRSLSFINYKLGQWMAAPPDSAKMQELPFSPERFSPRSRMYIQAEPDWLERQLTMTGSYEASGTEWISEIEELLQREELNGVPKLVIVVPHFAQIDEAGRQKFRTLGGEARREILEQPQPRLYRELQTMIDRHPDAHVLDLRESFRAARDSVSIYFNNDPHLTGAGQAIPARKIAHWLDRIFP